LRAGIKADLAANKFRAKNGSRWNIAYFSPTDTPLRALARALAQPGVLFNRKVKPDFEDEVYRKLNASDNGLIHVCEEAEVRNSANILLLIDDFSECFSEETPHQDRDRFYNLLLNASEAPNIAFYVMPCMKIMDVHHSNIRNYPLLLRAVRRSQHQLYELEEAELYEAIAEPAKKNGITVSEEVCEYLVKDLKSKDDSMSELQRIMYLVWFEFLGDSAKKDKKLINLKYYYRISGKRPKASIIKKGERRSEKSAVKEESFFSEDTLQEDTTTAAVTGSLQEQAEKTFMALSASEQVIAGDLFKVLIENKDGKYIPRSLNPTGLELMLNQSITDIKAVADKFSFVIKIKSDAFALNETRLVSNWTRLKSLVEEEQKHADFFKTLSQAAIRHYINGEDLEMVWSKGNFEEAAQWKSDFQPNEYRTGLYGDQHELAMDFLTKGMEEYGISEAKARPNTKATPTTPKPVSGERKKVSIGRKKIQLGSQQAPPPTPAAPERKKITIKKK
ncbi:MAG: hypothetical protein ACI85O_001446, partial [Saprospiraceae bacterium]